MKTNPVYEMNAEEYNNKLTNILKDIPEFARPEWSYFVKSGLNRQRPPQEADFWHKRAASILRQIYINRIVGVNKLRTRYGGRKDRGMKPAIFVKGGGKIIRAILQQADTAGLTEKVKAKKSGRQLTKKGREFMESLVK